MVRVDDNCGDVAGLVLPTILSVIAGSTDVISFLGLGGLVIVAGHVMAGQPASIVLLLSVPIFVLVLALTSLLAAWLERVGVASLQPLLLLQFLLLAGFLAFSVVGTARTDPRVASAIVAEIGRAHV